MPRAASTPAARWPRRGRTCSAPGSSASSPRTSRSDRSRPPAPRATGSDRMLIRGGTVIDPAQGLHAVRDVVVRDRRVTALGEPAPGEEVVDAHGLLVVPGLIDLHVPVVHGAS